MGVAVERAGDTVGGPTSVCHGSLGEEGFGHVDLGGAVGLPVRCIGRRGRGSKALGNMLPQCSDFADLLEEDERSVGRVTVDTNACTSVERNDIALKVRPTCTVVSSVLHPREGVAQHLAHIFPVLLHKE